MSSQFDTHLSTSLVRGPALLDRFHAVRAQTIALCTPLSAEDAQVQSMPDASPAKWHLAHTTWFFETFVVAPAIPGYQWVDETYQVLFNSYYNSVGPQHARPQRGLLTRPTLDQVMVYRDIVDQSITELASHADTWTQLAATIELGINHEQQHQELLLTDIKHLFSRNPALPSYRHDLRHDPTPAEHQDWVDHPGGTASIGAEPGRFSFDNEGPRHQVLLQPFAIARRPVTNQEFLAFIEDGGYQQATLWLSDGWDAVRQERWQAPLYWHKAGTQWTAFTLSGPAPLDPHAPVCHVSYFEADAYATWAGARLPREAEWEVLGTDLPISGNFVEHGRLQPGGANNGAGANGAAMRMFGDVWEWTQSPYSAYPGYRAAAGALGEYNGKFMCNQLVLRGGSCASPADHLRASYRNFFQANARWQFSGIRLARDL